MKLNTISERDYEWSIEPHAHWSVFSPDGERIGQIDTVYEESYVTASQRSKTYKVDSYEVTVRGLDEDAVFYSEDYDGSARRALSAAKALARSIH